MGLSINDAAPDFEAGTTQGRIRSPEWIGDSWAVLSSHPKDFTPVCTTELGYMAKIQPELERRGVKVLGLSAKHRVATPSQLEATETLHSHRPPTQLSDGAGRQP